MNNNNRIEINLGNGLKLVAERNTISDFDREIFIGIEKDGVWTQDLALVRPSYKWKPTLVEYSELEWRDDLFDVLVWRNDKDVSFTEEFEIKRYEEEE